MAYVRQGEFPLGNMPQWPRFDPPTWQEHAVQAQAPPQIAALQAPPISPAGLFIGALAVLGAVGLICWAGSESDQSERRCSGCGNTGHDRRTCSHTGERRHFSRSIQRSKRCECCGHYYDTHRHHPRGRADDSDWLDVCNGCHLGCCHKGDFNNFATKPRFCLYTGRAAYWRTAG
jgi:hypothetical protein